MSSRNQQEAEQWYMRGVNTVFLMGSGASAHMQLNNGKRMPMDDDFISRIQDIKDWHRVDDIKEYAVEASDCVIKTLESLDNSPQGLKNLGMEEAFCRLEMLRMLGKASGVRTNKWKYTIDAFKDLIAIITSYCQPLEPVDVSTSYGIFVDKLKEYGSMNQYAVLTLEPIAKCWLCNRRCLIEACAGLFFWVSAARS